MVFKLFQNLQLFSLFLKFLCQQYLKISISSHNTELINISTKLLSQCVCIIGVLVSDFLLPPAQCTRYYICAVQWLDTDGMEPVIYET